MKKEIIVAKYDKDISWIENLNLDVKITVYRKDNVRSNVSENKNTSTHFLDNVGREMHTYFYHIYNNYETLSDYNFFVQDYPFDHWEDVIEIINSNNDEVFGLKSALNMSGFYGYHYNSIKIPSEKGGIMHTMHKSKHHDSGNVISCTNNGYPHDTTNTLNVDKYWGVFFDEPTPNIYEFIPGAHFCVTKERIHLRSKEFYGKLIDLLEKDYITPWIFERLLCYIFNPKYKIKQ